MSSTLVILSARSSCWLGRTLAKNNIEKRINTKTVTIFRSRTQTFNSYRSLRYASGNKSVIIFNDLKPIEIYIYAKKAPIYELSRSKASKTQQTCGYRHTRKTSGLSQWHRTDVALHSFLNNFASLGSFANVLVSVGTVIPCYATTQMELSTVTI